MVEIQPQPHGDVLNRENSLELSILIRFYQQQQQHQEQLRQQQLLQQQKQQYYRNKNDEHDEKDVDETSCINHDKNSFVNSSRQLFEIIKSNKKNYDVKIFTNKMREYPCFGNTILRLHHDQTVRKMHRMVRARNLDV